MNSMTGFGSEVFRAGQRSCRLELRSYNNRFLDVKVHLPWTSGALEGEIVSAIRRGGVHRGRLEVSIWEERGPGGAARLTLDHALARELGELLRKLAQALDCKLHIAASLIPPMKELFVQEEGALDPDDLWRSMEPGLVAALEHLLTMRSQEGQKLASDLSHHLECVEKLCAAIRELARQEPLNLRDRLTEKLRKLGLPPGDPATVDPARMAQEVAHFADRCDVSEELARLESHAIQLRAMFQHDGPVGRKIEFMLQELNRELNTIASKTFSTEITHQVVDAKALVEKMREQAQNVE